MKRTKKLAFILSVVLILNMFVAALSVSAATYTRTELETEENDSMNILGTYKYKGGLTLDRLLTAARTQEQGKPNKSYVWLPYGSATIGDPSWFESISDPDFRTPLTGDNLPPEIINITHDEWEEDTSETSWSSTISIPLTIYTQGMFNGTNRLTISGVKYSLTAGTALDDAAIAKLTEIAAKSEAVFKVEAGVVTELSGGGAELTEQQKVSIAYDAVRKGNYKDLPVTSETQDLKTAAVQKQVNTLITEAFKVKARTVSDVVATVTVDGTTYKVEIKCGETKDNFDIKDATFKVVAEVPTETPTFTTDLSTDEVTYDIKETPTVTPLTVLATVTDGGTISYQWYKNGAAIAGATDTSYTPSIETLGTATYYVVATNTKDGKTATATSKTATIITKDSNLPDAETPTITTNLATEAVYNIGDSAVLTVVANSPDGGTLSYQWYKDSTSIGGATSSTYTVDTTKASEATYYVQITNTKTETNPSYVDSNKLKVTVKEKEAEKLTVTFSSDDTTKGTVEAHVYESGKEGVVVTTSPAKVASGSKVVLLAKPTSGNVLDTWNSDNTQLEITYTIEKLTKNETVTANFIVKNKAPLVEAISGANVYATQLSDGTILVKPNGTTADKVEKDKKFVTEIEKDAFITGLDLAKKLNTETPPVVIETKNQITKAAADLKAITETFDRLIKTGTSTVSKYTVTGGVYDTDTNHPLSDATVALSGTTVSVKTDENGKYTINNVEDGTYTLNVTKTGYAPKNIVVTVSGADVILSENTALEKTVKITFSSNNLSAGTVEAYVYENKNNNVVTSVYKKSPVNIASGLKVVFVAKPTSDNVLENWNKDSSEDTTAISYGVVTVTSDTTVTANFVVKNKSTLSEAIVAATVYETDLGNGTIITISSASAKARVAETETAPKYYVEEQMKDAFIAELDLARKLYDEEIFVKIETKNQITTATKALSDATATFKGHLKEKDAANITATVASTVYENSVEDAVYNDVSNAVYIKLSDNITKINFIVTNKGNYTIDDVKVEGISDTISGDVSSAISGTALKLSDKWSVTVPADKNTFVGKEKYLVLSFTFKENSFSAKNTDNRAKVYIKFTPTPTSK